MAVVVFLFDVDSSRSLARQRVFRDRLNALDVYDEIEYISRYRVTRDILIQLEEKVSTFLHRSTIRSHAIPAATQLAVSLQLLATGSFQTVVASSHGISQPSVSRCIRTVTDTFCFYAKELMVFPNESEQLRNQQRFAERYCFPSLGKCKSMHFRYLY